ncbi:nitronate monooxygenase [Nodosilinea sp. LEGE 07088]|uniref:NAD(P)H-dependent flavin oxidoreductase n=1 Tax=Nodosilinea sp. LEGE 07088 TaxID=2777968 RepID=UPI00188196DD|nr:nitronate monooxygenase family protein [Nodosilinea sp. LEGE 07088]MBE9136437.1 nitronate monooxygenase [Nodosilinea sp. LEGE 07088]
MTPLSTLNIGQYTTRHPIIQGGMGIRISGAKLAAAVANAGGIGIISAMGLGMRSAYFDPHEPSPKKRHDTFLEANRLALIDELQTARALSPHGIIGVNVMVAAHGYEVLVKTAAQHGANLVISGAGLPLKLPEYTADAPTVALLPIVSSARTAKIICQKWQRQGRLPDAIVVENPNSAGGHLGAKAQDLDSPHFEADQVIPELIAYLRDELQEDIPLIAAGGIWDRADIDRAIALGASGVQIGTRFITTEECDADRRYKDFHLQATSEDVVIVSSPVGLPGRALRNPFVEKVAAGALSNFQEPCLVNCLKVCKFRDSRDTYCILRALDRAAQGDVETGLIFAGSHAGRAEKILPVAELMAELTGAE